MPAAPSLLIVPYRSKTGKLYSQIPTSGAGDFTVTRNTEARRVNSAGLIESVASGIPRLDYYTSGGTAGCPALLVEPSGTNLCLQSENFLTTWSTAGTNITVTTGSTAAFTAPDGTTSADLLTATANGSARIIQSFTFVSGTTYTYSAFAKAGSGFFGLTMENNGITSGVAVIWNLNTGALAVSGVVGAGYTLQSQGIENYGNGWYRCRITVLLGLGAAGNIRANTSDGTMSAAIINSASGNTAYVWGAQLETGSVATSYIPTTAGTGSRSADVISVTGAVSGCIGQTEGTLYFEIDAQKTAAATRNVIEVTDGTSSNRFFARLYDDSGTQRIEVALINSGGFAARYQNLAMPAGIYKVAFAYAQNNFACFVNGVQNGITDTSGNCSASYSTINLGSAFGGVSFFNDRIRAVALYTTRLTNAELASLTAP